jgi:hypothetical protein
MAKPPQLRYVDPYKRRGRVYLAVCRFANAKAAAWLSPKLAWKLDPFLLRLTRGRLSTTGPRVFPAFAGYRTSAAEAGRVIPIIRLVPRAPD